jgi:carboxymethylenebutenolidase
MGRRTRRILIGIVGILLIGVLGLVGWVIFDSQAGESSSSVANVTFPAADGTLINGVLAQPGTDGKYPAMIMVHEWWGLNTEIKEMAQILAIENYVVLAPDTYRGKVATTVPGAIALRVSADKDRVDSDMQAAFDYLASLPNVDPARIGVMGFCYGGGVALRHAVNNPQIAVTVNLYGEVIEDAANFGALLDTKRPVLGIFGEADQQIPVAEANAFRVALETAQIPSAVTIYPGMPHAFVNPSSIADVEGEPRRAWQEILRFLAITLHGAST